MKTRICCVCKIEKDLTPENFYREKRRSDGFGSRCKACNNAVVKNYYNNHRDIQRTRAIQYAASHKSDTLARVVKWRAENIDRPNANARRRYRENPEKFRIISATSSQKRRAFKIKAPINNLTKEEWATIQKSYKYRCAYCGIKPKSLEQDHITPLARGGSHTMGNIAPACRTCNRKKYVNPPPVPVQPLLI